MVNFNDTTPAAPGGSTNVSWQQSGDNVSAYLLGVSAIQPYDLVCSLVGKPGAGATVLIFTAVRAVTLPANFSGSYGSVGTANTSTAVYTVKNGSTTIGTVTLTTGGSPVTVTFTFATTGGTSKSLAAGDRLTVIAPGSQDATLSDVGFTLAGTR